MQPSPDNTVCDNTCPSSGYYPDISTRTCLPCNAGVCTICTGPGPNECS
jgi:hypothetical protein